MKQESPLSFRIEPELNRRLEECSKRLRVKKYTLALLALEAAVDAVEKNDYRIALPIQFNVTHVATPKPVEIEKYPQRTEERVVLAEENKTNSPPIPVEDLVDEIISHTESDLGFGKKPSRRKKKSGAPEK